VAATQDCGEVGLSHRTPRRATGEWQRVGPLARGRDGRILGRAQFAFTQVLVHVDSFPVALLCGIASEMCGSETVGVAEVALLGLINEARGNLPTPPDRANLSTGASVTCVGANIGSS
jgi:hypothetical protein